MAVIAVLGYGSLKLCADILHDTGVGVLIDSNPGSSMWHENVANATFDATGLNHIPYFRSNVLELYS